MSNPSKTAKPSTTSTQDTPKTTSSATPTSRIPTTPLPASRRVRTQVPTLDLPWYARTRAKVLAVGVLVIVCSSSLIGAYLRTWKQERDAAQLAAGAEGTGETTLINRDVDGGTAVTRLPAATFVPKEMNAAEKAEALRDIDRSISTLENRRGSLVTRRMQEEGRLQNLRERMRKKEELERERERVAGPGR